MPEIFSYSTRITAETFKNGRPKKWAVDLFEDEMSGRVGGLQTYLSVVAKQRDVRSPDPQAGRALSVECGRLWPPENSAYYTGTLDDMSYDPRYIGPVAGIGPAAGVGVTDGQEKTYLLALYKNVEIETIPGKKPSTHPEFEVCVVSDSEDFCVGVGSILTQNLPRGIIRSEPRHIGISTGEPGEFMVGYNGSPFAGLADPLIKVRFG